MGTTLTITAKGQVTLRKEVIQHLGVKPGEKVVVDFLSAGRAELRAAKSPASIDGFIGCLRRRGSRAAVGDDPDQSRLTAAVLLGAEIVGVTLPTLCEFVRILAHGYGEEAGPIATVDAGLVVFEAGGDFADGVVAFEGRRLGGLIFTSFDRKAVELIAATGAETRLLSAE